MNAPIINLKTLKAFTPKSPDWKQLYYSMALRVFAASVAIKSGCSSKAESILEGAAKVIDRTEERIEMDNSILGIRESDKGEP